MATTNGEKAGSVSEVEEMGDGYGFMLRDGTGLRIAAFAFSTEETAGAWRELMTKMIGETVAIAHDENSGNSIAVH